PIAKPKSIVFTDDLPKTRSGKLMRRLLTDISDNRQLGDVTTLANHGLGEELGQNAALPTEDRASGPYASKAGRDRPAFSLRACGGNREPAGSVAVPCTDSSPPPFRCCWSPPVEAVAPGSPSRCRMIPEPSSSPSPPRAGSCPGRR